MKSVFKLSSVLPLLACVSLAKVEPLGAQSFCVLHDFTETISHTNGVPFNLDGVSPQGGLVAMGDTLYGTTISGGAGGVGTLFKVNIDGTGFTNLHIFTPVPDSPFTNSDGVNPNAGLILSGKTLFGTTVNGGSFGQGTVFKIQIDGTGFTNLYNFTGFSDGAYPWAGVVLWDNTLYGTTVGGFAGTVYRINTDGTGFATLYAFSGYPDDGSSPYAGLCLQSNTLYGTTTSGGSHAQGTVFALNTNGTGFTTLYNFTGDNDGAGPYDSLIIISNRLFGTALGGGNSQNGTVFRINTDGSGFAALHQFSVTSDGGKPGAGLVAAGNILYGTAPLGGRLGSGTVFKMNVDGTQFENIYNFTGGDDGATPSSPLVFSRNSLYGTASRGGQSGNGTVFRLSLGLVNSPQLSLIPSGGDLIFMWPTNAVGVVLESTTDLGSSSIWTLVPIQPVVINGQNTVTNHITATQQFFRLNQ